MAVVPLTVQQSARTSNGINITDNDTAASSGNSYTFANNGRVFLYVQNASGSSLTLTVATPNTVDGLAVADLTATVATAKDHIIGPFPPGVYNDGSGLVSVTVDQSVTIMAIRL